MAAQAEQNIQDLLSLQTDYNAGSAQSAAQSVDLVEFGGGGFEDDKDPFEDSLEDAL